MPMTITEACGAIVAARAAAAAEGDRDARPHGAGAVLVRRALRSGQYLAGRGTQAQAAHELSSRAGHGSENVMHVAHWVVDIRGV